MPRAPATDDAVLRHAPWWRWAFFAAGWIFFGLGVLGVLLPVLPTTPFMLLSLWAFSNSSERFRSWLYHHRVFGPPLQGWHRHRVIPLRVKVVAWSFMDASLAWAALIARAHWYGLAGMAAVMAVGAAFIARCPSRVP